MTITEILTSPEGKTLEFKRDTSALKQIMRTIVAFANTAGGGIVIGRDDNGDIVGVADPLGKTGSVPNSPGFTFRVAVTERNVGLRHHPFFQAMLRRRWDE